MTKSQNTKNEQHCIKQNEKSFIQKDLSLTELWQKGELPSGEYYIIDDLGLHTTDRYYPSHGFGAELPQSILGRVPTFDEWEASEKYNKHLEEVIKIYERKDKQATETSIAYNELLEENAQLKELLGECLAHLSNGELGLSVTPLNFVIEKIKEVLK